MEFALVLALALIQYVSLWIRSARSRFLCVCENPNVTTVLAILFMAAPRPHAPEHC